MEDLEYFESLLDKELKNTGKYLKAFKESALSTLAITGAFLKGHSHRLDHQNAQLNTFEAFQQDSYILGLTKALCKASEPLFSLSWFISFTFKEWNLFKKVCEDSKEKRSIYDDLIEKHIEIDFLHKTLNFAIGFTENTISLGLEIHPITNWLLAQVTGNYSYETYNNLGQASAKAVCKILPETKSLITQSLNETAGERTEDPIYQALQKNLSLAYAYHEEICDKTHKVATDYDAYFDEKIEGFKDFIDPVISSVIENLYIPVLEVMYKDPLIKQTLETLMPEQTPPEPHPDL